MKKIVQILLTISLLGCGLSNQGKDSKVCSPTGGTSAFKTTVFAFTSTKCAGCHGASTAPLFAVSDGNAAESVTRSFVNFSDLASSRLLTKATDGHSGAAVASNREPLLAALNEWAKSDSGGSVSNCTTTARGAFETTRVPLPANVPTSTTNFMDMQWEFEGFSLLVGVQVYQTDTKYLRFKNPRIRTGSETVYLKDPMILINGKRDDRNQFLVDGTAGAPSVTTILSTATILVAKEATNEVSIQFSDYHKGGTATLPTDPGGGGSPEMIAFLRDVKPILLNRCVGCHANVGAYRLTLNDDNMLRLNTIAKTNTTNETTSLFFRKARDNNPAHSGGVVLNPNTNAADINKIIAWMQMLP